MSPYVAEAIPTEVLKDLLDTNWNDQEGNTPLPELIEVTAVEPRVDMALEQKDYVVIRMEDTGVQEKWRNAYDYADVIINIRLEIYTQHSRQRLYDLMQEIRRIIRAQKHNVGTYQLVRYLNFNELTSENLNLWLGLMRVSLESAGIAI